MCQEFLLALEHGGCLLNKNLARVSFQGKLLIS